MAQTKNKPLCVESGYFIEQHNIDSGLERHKRIGISHIMNIVRMG